MIDSIIFDLDGTLWDATYAIHEGWNRALKNAGYDIHVKKEQIESVMGLSVEGIADKIFPQFPKEERMTLIRHCFNGEEEVLAEKGGILMEGLKDVLEVLKEKYRLFIVSNCQDGYVQIFLKVHQMEEYFEDFICAGDSGMSKGQNNLKLMRERELKSPVYVGDTRGDMNSAIEAEIPYIHCRFGFGDLKESEYEHGIDALCELPALLKTI